MANVYEALEDASAIGRYNGNDTITIGLKKQQSSSDMEVSQAASRVMKKLQADDADLEMIVISDNSEMIESSLKSVANTMVMAIIISMVVIFLFFGDMKASLIVGSSFRFLF